VKPKSSHSSYNLLKADEDLVPSMATNYTSPFRAPPFVTPNEILCIKVFKNTRTWVKSRKIQSFYPLIKPQSIILALGRLMSRGYLEQRDETKNFGRQKNGKLNTPAKEYKLTSRGKKYLTELLEKKDDRKNQVPDGEVLPAD